MTKKLALQIILVISIAGILFSGYLSYDELFTGKCPVGGCVWMLGLPACVYGFVMYTIVMIISLLGLTTKK